MLRATIRQSLGVNSLQKELCVTLRANSDGLRIQAVAEQHASNILSPVITSRNASLFRMLLWPPAKGGSMILCLFTIQADTVTLQSSEDVSPQSVQIPAVEPADMPPVPDYQLTNDCWLVTAMRDAMATTENESVRCATNYVRLRDSGGPIARGFTQRRTRIAASA